MFADDRELAAEGSRSRLTGDAGSATLQAVVTMPVVLLTTFTIVQAVLYFMANTAVTNGAQIALEISRAQSSSAQAGQTAAGSYLADQGALRDSNVTVSRGAESVTVTTTATAPSLVPFVSLPPVRSHLTGPVERVTRP